MPTGDPGAAAGTSEGTQRPIKTRRSPEFRRIYSNSFRYRITASELTLTFQYVTDDPETSSPDFIDEVELTMSHSQAKNLLLYLEKLVSAFEKEFGVIKNTGGPSDEAVTEMITRIKNVGFR